ncbi:hypothetical protein JST97_29970 [bacterium]|nr:hypothetical protein [bacterium]
MTSSNTQEAQVKRTYFAPVFVCGTMGAGQNSSEQPGFEISGLVHQPNQED